MDTVIRKKIKKNCLMENDENFLHENRLLHTNRMQVNEDLQI